VLENQLFAQSLKGVIDFLCTLQGKGLTKNRSEGELEEVNIKESVFMIPDYYIFLNYK